jgi:hypothetical protein
MKNVGGPDIAKVDRVSRVGWSNYWDCWDSGYDSPDAQFAPDAELFHTTMVSAGLSPSAVQSLAESGFVMFKGFPELVVDRFYGEPIMRVDGRTHFQTQRFVDWLKNGSSDFTVE